MNEPEIRPSSNVIISRSNAYEFLANSKSELESITAKYYEIIATSSSSTGFTSNITLADVLTGLTDTLGEATGILGSVAASSKESSDINKNPDFASDTDTIAGESTSDSNTNLQSSTNIDVVGLAAFKGDVMVRRT